MFITKNDLKLINGGYLVTEHNIPVYHKEFVELQNEAHYLINLAEKVKLANFNEVKPDSFLDLVEKTKNELANTSQVTYVENKKQDDVPTIDTLVKEAINWVNTNNINDKNDKVNHIMQKYNLLNEFETFGLYFSQETIVKLEKVYTISDILQAIIILEPHLD